MTDKLTNELNDILSNNRGNLYDFICNHYYEMSKDEIKDLAKECISLLYEKAEIENTRNGKPYDRFNDLHKELLNNIKEYTSLLEDDE